MLANDLYHQLTQEGFKVFFSRITLEDKLGTAYEPYIFAALNSAKVMVVIGTKPEYFNAVWVKNEWSRYLALIKGGAKKMLIPAYRDMDPYDLPEEFSHLQAQDMSKLGFMQDLIRGIKKLTGSAERGAVRENVTVNGDLRIAPLLKRTFMFLEDGNWEEADKYAEKVLDMDPECAEAYLCKLMAELKVKKRADIPKAITEYPLPYDENPNYNRVMHFADDKLKQEIVYAVAKYHAKIGTVEEYEKAVKLMESFNDGNNFINIIEKCKKSIQYVKDQDKKQEKQQWIIALFILALLFIGVIVVSCERF